MRTRRWLTRSKARVVREGVSKNGSTGRIEGTARDGDADGCDESVSGPRNNEGDPGKSVNSNKSCIGKVSNNGRKKNKGNKSIMNIIGNKDGGKDCDAKDETTATEGKKTSQQAGGGQAPTPRYSVPRHEGPRYASGPPGRPFLFLNKPRTVAGIWLEYKVGSGGNPALEALEREYGTGWRRGTLRERKYASNYVGNRRTVVEYVEGLAKNQGWAIEETIQRIDERVDGRISALTDALRQGQDPFEALSLRVKDSELEQEKA